jgi:TonB family protein
MRATRAGLAGTCALGILLISNPVSAQTTETKYHAAGVSQAGTIAFPLNTKTPGFVSVDALVTSNGMPQDVVVVRDTPPMTGAVVSSVRGWHYTPATVNDHAVPGIVPITVAFNPFNPSGVGLPGQSLQPAQVQVVSNFQPPHVVQASYANYPPDTVTSGTIVLKVRVGSSGRVHDVTVIRGKDALNAPSISAARNWQFTPAMYKSKAVAADVIVAFVYAPPEAGTR